MQRFIISTLVATAILFSWSGVTQMLPWGVPSSQNVTAQTNVAEEARVPNLLKVTPNALTTAIFDEQFVGKISTYTTDKTFSWIVTQPLNTNYSGYFIKEGVTQFIVALLLSLLLLLTVRLTLKTRMALVIIAALAAVSAIYGQLMNWWSLPINYALGVSLNLMIGWVLASFISARFILKEA
jgi:hypothetical protein